MSKLLLLLLHYLFHPWSFIVIIILVEIEQGLEAMYVLIQISFLPEERDGWLWVR